jgi:dTMP kinase
MSIQTRQLSNRFITFEGIEGAGKSTQIQFASEFLRAQNQPVVVTREPGGTGIANEIRQLLLTTQEEALTDEAELLLMFAARSQHLTHVVKPALARGDWVLCDRFTDSTIAYQGYGRGVQHTMIVQLKQWVQGDLNPARTFLFDLPVESALLRVRTRGERDRFEQEQLEFYTRVRQGFINLAEQEPQRIICLNAAQSIELVRSELRTQLELLFEN